MSEARVTSLITDNTVVCHCQYCKAGFGNTFDREHHETFCGYRGIPYDIAPDTEPADQLSAIDRSILILALDLYYADMDECGKEQEANRIRALSRRLADPGKTWKAER